VDIIRHSILVHVKGAGVFRCRSGMDKHSGGRGGGVLSLKERSPPHLTAPKPSQSKDKARDSGIPGGSFSFSLEKPWGDSPHKLSYSPPNIGYRTRRV